MCFSLALSETLYIYKYLAADDSPVLKFFYGLLFDCAVFLDTLALFLRTDSSLLPVKVKPIIKLFLMLTIVFGLVDTLEFPTYPLLQTIAVISGVLLGVAVLVIDSIFTYYFVQFVRNSKHHLGKTHTSVTSLIARHGLRITFMSWVVLVVDLLSDLLQDYYYPLKFTSRLCVSSVLVLWIVMKVDIDRQKDKQHKLGNEQRNNQAAVGIRKAVINNMPTDISGYVTKDQNKTEQSTEIVVVATPATANPGVPHKSFPSSTDQTCGDVVYIDENPLAAAEERRYLERNGSSSNDSDTGSANRSDLLNKSHDKMSFNQE